MEDNQSLSHVTPTEKLPPPSSVKGERLPPFAPAPKVYMWRHPLTWVAFASLALLGWQWYGLNQQLIHTRQEMAKRISDNDNALKAMQTLVRQGKEDLNSAQGKLSLLEATVAQSAAQQTALTAMYQEFSQARDERLLSEVEQAINIATQQLQLAGNIPAALIALQSADSRLSSLGKTQFLVLRKAIAHDIETLKAMPAGDLESTALVLESVIGRIDRLPFAFERHPNVQTRVRNTSASFFERLGSDLWQEFKQLVRIERLDRPDPALLSPAQTTFLRENLRLRLLSARLALLQHDQRIFIEDVRQAANWLTRYFDIQDKLVKDTLAELNTTQGANVAFSIPKLDESMNALRAAQQHVVR